MTDFIVRSPREAAAFLLQDRAQHGCQTADALALAHLPRGRDEAVAAVVSILDEVLDMASGLVDAVIGLLDDNHNMNREEVIRSVLSGVLDHLELKALRAELDELT